MHYGDALRQTGAGSQKLQLGIAHHSLNEHLADQLHSLNMNAGTMLLIFAMMGF